MRIRSGTLRFGRTTRHAELWTVLTGGLGTNMEPCAESQGDPERALHHAENREHPAAPAALMPGDDAALLTPGRMSQRGKEAGLQTPGKDLLTSPSLSPGFSYSHGELERERGREREGGRAAVSNRRRECECVFRAHSVSWSISGSRVMPVEKV
ncbi:hypothetical protein E1301_Tti011450 [Triplophysa tibetana]|uniref:Uncharacterized protein n=1 Tax=Triplophysa tibetana TaxID=1572043 RepID=A0A5A9PJC2_9TELE|nr:hypothetical protein E1301_Tti011450 [Triplophysa tibetana]